MKKIKLVFNEKDKLIEFHMEDSVTVHELPQVLPSLINSGIQKISIKAQEEFMKFRRNERF